MHHAETSSRIAWNVNEMFQIQKNFREELITSWEVANWITRAIFEHLKALSKLKQWNYTMKIMAQV